MTEETSKFEFSTYDKILIINKYPWNLENLDMDISFENFYQLYLCVKFRKKFREIQNALHSN